MDATREEAMSLLRGWRDERRIVVATLSATEQISCCVIGRIEELNDTRMRIDDESISQSEARTGIELDLPDARGFSFSDTRIVAGFDDAERIRENYDGFLLITFANRGVMFRE